MEDLSAFVPQQDEGEVTRVEAELLQQEHLRYGKILAIAGTDRQRMWLDDALKLPFVMEMYDGPERAFRIEIEKFAFDRRLPVNTFRLD